MRLAYIVVCYFNFEQTLRLFNRLNHKDSFFVFHVSKKCEPQYYEKLYTALKDRENCFFAKRVPVIWSNFSFVQAMLNAIDTLIESNVDFEYVSLISGQDYPIKSHTNMVRILNNNKGKEYLEFIPISELNHIRHWWEAYHFWVGKRRLWYPHQQSDNILIALYNFIFSIFIPKNRKLPDELILYKGSTAWTLTRDCIEFLRQQAKSAEGKKILKYFKHTWHPTELYVQTILMNSRFRDHIINNDQRFILWPENDNGHPRILTEADYNDIVASERLFARKFSLQVDAKIFDLLDEKITD